MNIQWKHIFGNTSAEEECYEFIYGGLTKKKLVKFLRGYGKEAKLESEKMLLIEDNVLRNRIKSALRKYRLL